MTRKNLVSGILWDQRDHSRSILTDYHMHSTFSPDASNSLDQMCQHALQIGFEEIAFTEHVEWHPDWHGTLDIYSYLSAVQTLKSNYIRKGLKIYAGVEIGNPHDYPDQASEILHNPQIDVIIAALHWLHGENIHLAECFAGRDPNEVYIEYFCEIRRMSDCCDFDILAHFDRIFLAGSKFGYIPKVEQLESVIRSTFTTMAENNQILELNTKLFGHMPPFWKDIMATIISWFREEGGSGVSVGSDAHNIFEIGRHFDVAEEILESTQSGIILPGRNFNIRERLINC
jgi:histidinol-phosphatase (PHP family)